MLESTAPGMSPERKVLTSGTPLKCFCPHCRASLIEGGQIVVEVERPGGERGNLQLSPLFNVFESSSTIALPEGEEVADLFCPRCRVSLREDEKRCDECGSHIGRIWIRMDTENIDFYLCLRKHCYWHGISDEARDRLILDIAGFKPPEDRQEMIRTGTKLQCFCPSCGDNLVQGENLTVRVVDHSGKTGELALSPYLNVFRSESSLSLPPGEEIRDMVCPRCGCSLRVDSKSCGLCGSPTAKFRVRASVLDVDFYICLRKECHWHGLSEGARRRIILDESMEW